MESVFNRQSKNKWSSTPTTITVEFLQYKIVLRIPFSHNRVVDTLLKYGQFRDTLKQYTTAVEL